MKNTKLVKILTSALAVILLICAMVCVTALAENTAPTVEIKYKNLSYGGTISIAFAVKADDYDAVDLLVYESEPQDPATEAANYTIVDYLEKSTIYGEELAVFLTPGIAPRYMNKQIYAVARLSTADGYVYSDVVRYSITEYAYEVQYDEALADEYVTFGETLISYGDQIKGLLGDTDLKPSDMSYVAIADGYEGTIDGKYSAGIFSATDKITLPVYTGTAPEGQSYAGKWTSSIDGNITIEDGVPISVSANAIFSPLFASNYVAGVYYNSETDGTRYAFDTNDTTGITGGTIANGALGFSGNGAHGIANNMQANFEEGTKYVFEADFTYLGGAPKTADLNAAFVGLLSNGTVHNNNMMVYSYLKFTDENAQAITMFNTRFEKGVKYNIAIEYTVGDNSNLSTGTTGADYTARNNYAKENVAFYVNEVKQDLANCTDIALGYGSSFADDKNFYGFGVYTRNSSYTSSLDLEFDNVYIGPKGSIPEEKIDSYYETATTGTKYSFDTDGDTSAVVEDDDHDSNTGKYGDFTAADGKLTLSGNPAWYAFAFKNADYDSTKTYANGTKYVFEADITYNGGQTKYAAADNSNYLSPAFVGFYSANKGDFTNGNMFSYNYANYTTPSDGTNFADSNFELYGVDFAKGETKNVTFIYTVGTKTNLEVYVDGVKTADYTLTNNSADTNFYGFGFYCRGAGYTNNLSLTFDNVYLGVVEAQ
ncbi:MAG: hypothetical protein J6B48_09420 [Clostridia bacterium]|nr:hypothetical protein [Clostridia bacterium]